MRFTIDAEPDELADLLARVTDQRPRHPDVPLWSRLADTERQSAPVERAVPGAEATPHRVEGEDLAQQVRNVVHGEMSHFLRDVEFRVAQAYDVERRSQRELSDTGTGKVYAEDLHISRHQITGYTVTANSPAAGSIAWASVHIVHNGTDYTMADGNTANRYVWFDPAAVNGTTALQSSNTKPTLTANATLVFINDNGTPRDAISASIPYAIGDNAVDSNSILAGAVGSTALAAGSVIAGKIGTDAVTSTQIAAGAVGSGELVDGAVTTVKIGTDQVTATQIAGGAVGTSEIATDAVTATQIATGAVGSGEIAAGAVIAGKIGTDAVTNTNLASNAVGSAELIDGAVTAGKVGAAAITAAKLNTLQHLIY